MEHIDFNIKNINIFSHEKLYNNNIKPLKSSFHINYIYTMKKIIKNIFSNIIQY